MPNEGFSWIGGMHYISLLASGQAFTSLLLTTTMSQSQDVPEHEIQTYLRVSEALAYLQCGIPIKINTTLSKGLDAMSCVPVIQFPARMTGCALFIESTPAGTLDKPEVELLL
jgi:hypothetical protein